MNKKNWILGSFVAVIVLLAISVVGTSCYMLNYSLGYTHADRKSVGSWKQRVANECPWTVAWMDSIYANHCVKDTFVEMPSGYKAHAIYMYAPEPTRKTAVVVHGYKVRAEGMLHIAYLYNHDLKYNVLLPDLYGHGLSEGDHIQMGWNDRWDVMRWSGVANEIFAPKTKDANTEQVLHGISMGAATVMAVSGEMTPMYVKWFVEDCGFSSVWDEFEAQLKDQFGLPSFPLMNVTSWLCRERYGWSFVAARQIDQVKASTKPMLFIHGDKDAFVPYAMLRPLYDAKTHGRKAMWIARGSVHAMAYSDHREEYTREVEKFLK